VAKSFKPDPDPLDLCTRAEAFATKLPEAELCPDQIAEEARCEARLFSAHPAPLLRIVERTRRLSAR
jgi:hypothetical protein